MDESDNKVPMHRHTYCTRFMDNVDRIMQELAKDYAIEENEQWKLARDGCPRASDLTIRNTYAASYPTSPYPAAAWREARWQTAFKSTAVAA